jgi:small multidrug resistance family-3 protein
MIVTALKKQKVNQDMQIRKILITLFFFLLVGLCEIGGGYLVWLWLREDMSWILGVIGGFILFLYGIVPTFQSSYFHRIYAAYGGIFIVMVLLWGLIFEGIVPDMFDIIGAAMACVGVAIIYYAPRRGEEKLWSIH